MTDDYEDFEDPEVAALLRGHADRLTGPIDVDGALRDVQQRARVRRRWRAVGSALTAAAAAVAIVVTASVLVGDDDRPTVRTPAAQPAAPSTATATTPPASSVPSTAPPSTSGPTSTDSTTTTSRSTPTTSAPAGAPATQPRPTPASPSASTSTFTSAGGSIVVTLSNDAISLADDPSPSPGWSYRIDDDGPSRVRVRFERDDQRSEIRVDLQGDQLVPDITED